MTTLQYHKKDLSNLSSKHPSLNEVDQLARKYNALYDQEVTETVLNQFRKISNIFTSHH